MEKCLNPGESCPSIIVTPPATRQLFLAEESPREELDTSVTRISFKSKRHFHFTGEYSMLHAVHFAPPSLRARVFLCLVVGLTAISGTAWGGKYNSQLSPGDKSPSFSELEGTDGKKHSLAELEDAEVVVLFFTCNSCPYAVDVEDRVLELAKSPAVTAGKCALVAIGSNTIEADSLEAMKKKAQEKGFPFLYLYDSTQQVAKSFGASRTPEFFVFDKERKLVYQGAFDDSPDGKMVKAKYVEQAVTDTLGGKTPVVQETIPVGCAVRYLKMRGGKGAAKK